MKSQWMIILGFVFALIVAIFAIVNVGLVEFNYLFGKINTPLILIILISTLFGGLTVGFLGMFRIYVLSKQLKQYQKEWMDKGFAPLPQSTPFFAKKSKAKQVDEHSAQDSASVSSSTHHGDGVNEG